MLGHQGQRDQDRAGLVSDLQQDIANRESDAFDLDAVAGSELDEPVRPAPLYDLDDLDAVLRTPELLPHGVETRRLAPREYELLAPGMPEALRVTTSRELFEDQPETYELWSPGSPLFPWGADNGDAAVSPGETLRLKDLLKR